MTGAQKGLLILICAAFVLFAAYRTFTGMRRIRDERTASLLEENASSIVVPRTKKRTFQKTKKEYKYNFVRRAPVVPAAPVIRNEFQEVMDLMEADKLQEARDILEELAARASTTSDLGLILYLNAEISFRSGDGIGAAAYYTRLLKDYPEHPAASNARAALEYLTRRRG